LKAYEINPNDKIIVEHIGDGYFKADKVSKAVEYWKKALELGSTNKNLKLKIEKQEYYEPIY
jgi:prefoldin subunit 5